MPRPRTPPAVRARIHDDVLVERLENGLFKHAAYTRYLVWQMEAIGTRALADEAAPLHGDLTLFFKQMPRPSVADADVKLDPSAGAVVLKRAVQAVKNTARGLGRVLGADWIKPEHEPYDPALTARAIRETIQLSPESVDAPRKLAALADGRFKCFSVLEHEAFEAPELDAAALLKLKLDLSGELGVQAKEGIRRASTAMAKRAPVALAEHPSWIKWKEQRTRRLLDEPADLESPITPMARLAIAPAYLGAAHVAWLVQTATALPQPADANMTFARSAEQFFTSTRHGLQAALDDNPFSPRMLDEFDGGPLVEVSSSTIISEVSAASRSSQNKLLKLGALPDHFWYEASEEMDEPLMPWRHSDASLPQQALLPPIIPTILPPSSPPAPSDPANLETTIVLRNFSAHANPRGDGFEQAMLYYDEHEKIHAPGAGPMYVPRMRSGFPAIDQRPPRSFAEAGLSGLPVIRQSGLQTSQMNWSPFRFDANGEVRLAAAGIAPEPSDQGNMPSLPSRAQLAEQRLGHVNAHFRLPTGATGQTPARPRWQVAPPFAVTPTRQPHDLSSPSLRASSAALPDTPTHQQSAYAGEQAWASPMLLDNKKAMAGGTFAQQGRALAVPAKRPWQGPAAPIGAGLGDLAARLSNGGRADTSARLDSDDDLATYLRMRSMGHLAPPKAASAPSSEPASTSPAIAASATDSPADTERAWLSHPSIKNPAWYAELSKLKPGEHEHKLPVLAHVALSRQRDLIRGLREAGLELIDREATCQGADLVLSPRLAILFRKIADIPAVRSTLLEEVRIAVAYFPRVLIVIETLPFAAFGKTPNSALASINPLSPAVLKELASLRRAIELSIASDETSLCKPDLVFACDGAGEVGRVLRAFVEQSGAAGGGEAALGHGERHWLEAMDDKMDNVLRDGEYELIHDFGINSYGALYILHEFGSLNAFAFDMSDEERLERACPLLGRDVVVRFNTLLAERFKMECERAGPMPDLEAPAPEAAQLGAAADDGAAGLLETPPSAAALAPQKRRRIEH